MATESNLVLHSIRPGLAEMERFAEGLLADKLGRKADVVITVEAGGRRVKSCYAWTSAGYRTGKGDDAVIQPYWSTREGVPCIEIVMVAECLHRPAVDILATVAHECAHIVAIDRHIKDCAGSSRHNRRFVPLAEEMMLQVLELDTEGKPKDKSAGYGHTGPTVEFLEYVKAFNPNEAAFDVFRNLITKPHRPSRPKFTCPNCHDSLYGHDETRDGRGPTNVICGKCMVHFKRDTGGTKVTNE